MDTILKLIASFAFWIIFGLIWYGISDLLKEIRTPRR